MDTPNDAGVFARLRAAVAGRLAQLAVPNWRQVLRHAWSVQLDVLGIVLTILQAGVDVLSGNPPIDPVKFAIIAMTISGLSLVLRFVRQDKVSGGA